MLILCLDPQPRILGVHLHLYNLFIFIYSFVTTSQGKTSY
jgi:hypothetical protein